MSDLIPAASLIAEIGVDGETAAAAKLTAFGLKVDETAAKQVGGAQKIGSAFSTLDQKLGSFGLPFVGALGVVGEKLESTSTKGQGALKALSASGIAAGVGLLAASAESIHLADSFDQADQRLSVATKNVGENFKAARAEITATDDKMTNLGFTSTETESSMATLETATKSLAETTKDEALAADIARGRHTDLATATSLLVKVETGHVALLGRIGIDTKDATGKTIDQATALRRLSEYYGGQASAYLDTYAGKEAMLKAKADDIGVSLGHLEKEVLVKVADAVTAGVGAFEKFNSELDGVPGKAAAAGAGLFVVAAVGAKVITTVQGMAAAYGLSSGAERAAAESSVASATEQVTAEEAVAAAIGVRVAAAQADAAQEVIANEAVITSSDLRIAAEQALAAAVVDADATQAAAGQALLAQVYAAADAQVVITSATDARAAAQAGLLTSDEALVASAGQVAAADEAAALAALHLQAAQQTAAVAADVDAAAQTGVGMAAAQAGLGYNAAALSLAAMSAEEQAAVGTTVGLGVALTGLGLGVGVVAAIGVGFEHLIGSGNLDKFVKQSEDAGKALATTGELAGPATAEIKALGPAAVTALTQATDAILGGKTSLAGLRNEYDSLSGSGKIAFAGVLKGAQDAVNAMGPAAKATALLSAAQVQLADDTTSAAAGDAAAAGRLTTDKAAVTGASRTQATAQDAVNTATQQGAAVATDAAAAAKTQAAALTAVDVALTKLNTDSLTFVNSDLALRQANIEVGNAAQTYRDKLVAVSKAKNDGGQASRDAASAEIGLGQSITASVKDAQDQAAAHVALNTKLTGTNLKIQEGTAANVAAKHEIDVLKFMYPGLTAEIDAYGVKLGLIPKTVTTTPKVDTSGAYADAAAYTAAVNAMHPTIHTTINVPSVIISAQVAAGGKFQGVPNGGNSFSFDDGGYVPGPKGTAVPAIVHAGEFVVSNKMQDDAKAASRSLTTGPLSATSADAPDVSSSSRAHVIIDTAYHEPTSTARGTPDRPDPKTVAAPTTTTTADPAAGTSTTTQALSALAQTALSTLPGATRVISDFNTSITDGMTASAAATKAADKAATAYTKTQGVLSSAQQKTNEDLKKYTAIDNAAQLKTNADLKQFTADKAAGQDPTKDLMALAADYKLQDVNKQQSQKALAVDRTKEADANKTNLAARADAGKSRLAAVAAKKHAAQATDVGNLTVQVNTDTSTLKLFQAQLEKLEKANDTELVKELITTGPEQGEPIARAFAANLPKAAAFEKALVAQEAEDTTYGQFVGSFDTGGIVPGPLGQPVPIIAHGGEWVDNTPLHDHGTRSSTNNGEILVALQAIQKLLSEQRPPIHVENLNTKVAAHELVDVMHAEFQRIFMVSSL